MINQIMSMLQRPEMGWDPVDRDYATTYAEHEYTNMDYKLVDQVEAFCGMLSRKKILDLGGGPGQYSIEFAKRGAKVIWHDVSRNYLSILEQKDQTVSIKKNIGYLEEAKGKYDIVFCRLCWYYSRNDTGFLKVLYNLTKDGGSGFIILNNDDFYERNKYSHMRWLVITLQRLFNNVLNIKIGHPHPSHKKIVRCFSRYRFKKIIIERKGHNTVIKYKKI